MNDIRLYAPVSGMIKILRSDNDEDVYYHKPEADTEIARLEAEINHYRKTLTGRVIRELYLESIEEEKKEILRLESEVEKLRGEYEALALHHDAAHSDASRKELENELVLANSLLDVIDQMADWKEPDDFSQSFPIVRKIWDALSGRR